LRDYEKETGVGTGQTLTVLRLGVAERLETCVESVMAVVLGDQARLGALCEFWRNDSGAVSVLFRLSTTNLNALGGAISLVCSGLEGGDGYSESVLLTLVL
jgi:hypothetical protein